MAQACNLITEKVEAGGTPVLTGHQAELKSVSWGGRIAIEEHQRITPGIHTHTSVYTQKHSHTYAHAFTHKMLSLEGAAQSEY